MFIIPNAKAQRWLHYLAKFILISGFVGFFGCFLCALTLEFIPTWLNLPLGDVGAIAVDSRGAIYCSSKGYYRIQKYSISGHFLYGMTSPYQNPKLAIDEYDRLHVLGYSKNEETIIDQSGHVVLIKIYNQPRIDQTEPNPLIWKSASGCVYKVRTPNLWPRVVKITPTGKTSTVINTSILMWLVAGPLPGGLRIIIGMLILKALKYNPKAG